MGYRDIFFDFDDTLYDTRGNADIALTEVFRDYGLDRFFSNPQFFYDTYWKINSELWLQYNKNYCCPLNMKSQFEAIVVQ